eukprot:scaffold26650_cov63-Phaeocystis_antarctica.AAC.10
MPWRAGRSLSSWPASAPPVCNLDSYSHARTVYLPSPYCLLNAYLLPTYYVLGLFVLVIAGYVKMKGNAANIKAEYIIKATAGADMQSGNVKIESKIAAASQGGAPTDSI